MTESTSVFEIPLLLDMICASLDPEDIWNFRVTHSNSDRISFFSNNSHHIRKLRFAFAALGTLDISHCTRLRELEMGLTFEDADEHDASGHNTMPETQTRAADLIQGNRYLSTLRIREMQSLSQLFLDAIKNHPFLTTLTVNVVLQCPFIPKLMDLPLHLLELDMRNDYGSAYCRAPAQDHPRELMFLSLAFAV
ncbi:hypothetical protein BGX31_005469 [Mortierella sp. GBA43]|nr:hypothetical protein BGX31_005469 [Mortierella sp. GBA43]